VHFVYEEFLEYILAKYFLGKYKENSDNDIITVVKDIMKISSSWVNAYGVVLYIALILFGSSDKEDSEQGFKLLAYLISKDETWIRTFWLIVGRLPNDLVGSRLFDMFYPALVKTPATMFRFSESTGAKIAAAILWSGSVPSELKWRDIAEFETMSEKKLKRLGDRLAKRIQQKPEVEKIPSIGIDHLLNLSLPYMAPHIRKKVRDARQKWGNPGPYDVIGLIYVIKREFIEQEPYLLNGLFHHDYRVAKFCADRIRFVKFAKPQITYLCERICKSEKRLIIKDTLENSIQWLKQDKIPLKNTIKANRSWLGSDIEFDLVPPIVDEDNDDLGFLYKIMDKEIATENDAFIGDFVYYPSE
jgi:hypothetical protein